MLTLSGAILPYKEFSCLFAFLLLCCLCTTLAQLDFKYLTKYVQVEEGFRQLWALLVSYCMVSAGEGRKDYQRPLKLLQQTFALGSQFLILLPVLLISNFLMVSLLSIAINSLLSRHSIISFSFCSLTEKYSFSLVYPVL